MDKKHFSKLGLTFCLATLLMILVQNLAIILLNVLGTKIPLFNESIDARFLGIMLPVYLIVYPLTLLVMKKIPATSVAEKKKMSIGQLLLAATMCYSLLYVFNIVGSVLTFLIGLLKQSTVTNNFTEIAGSIGILPNLLIVVICAPIAEELFFRKALIDRTAQYGEGVSIVLSGLLFALFHGNLNQAAYTFFMGCFLAFIYVKTRNVTYSILLHMICNFIGSILSSIVLKITGFNDIAVQMTTATTEAEIMNLLTENGLGILLFFGYALGLVCFVIIGVVMLLVKRKKFTLNAGEITIEKGQRFKTVLLNVGMLIYCIYWLAQIILQLFQ